MVGTGFCSEAVFWSGATGMYEENRFAITTATATRIQIIQQNPRKITTISSKKNRKNKYLEFPGLALSDEFSWLLAGWGVDEGEISNWKEGDSQEEIDGVGVTDTEVLGVTELGLP